MVADAVELRLPAEVLEGRLVILVRLDVRVVRGKA
jgi:hypothetical protein